MSREQKPTNLIREDAVQFNCMMWRNNSGAFKDRFGNMIRFGLANDSAKMNKHIKSPDLVGVLPVTIRPQHVGCVVGLFVGIEVKPEGWTMPTRPDDHIQSQQRFHDLITSRGGCAGFATGVEDFRRIIHATNER